MIIERTLYFAKPGKAGDVLEVRRRGSEVRVALGLSARTIYVRHGDSDAPDVQWECHFHTEEEQRADLEARRASADFTAIREEMQAVIDRFERHILRREVGGDVDLGGVSLAPQEHTFPSASAELTGFLYVPPGDGQFPCMILNHGSEIEPGSSDISKPAVASVLLSWGIACFFPNRWGYRNSPGKYWREEVSAEFGTRDYDHQLVRRLHRESDDVDNDPNPAGVRMGHFQMLLAGEVLRAKFRNSFARPEPLVPGEMTPIEFELRDRNHTFEKGHRIMVQIQSTWFPAIDRNPQTFVDIYTAKESDFHVSTHSIYRSRSHPSYLELSVVP